MTTPPRRATTTLAVAGAALLSLALVLLVTLALLPDGGPVASKTLSVGVYGPRGYLVRVALLVFGVGTYAMAGAFALELGGRFGRFSAAAAAVWATASAVDAVVSTSRPGQQSLHGLVHVAFALSGLLAQVVVAVTYPVLLRHRLARVPFVSALSSLLVVVGAALFVVGSRDGYVGAGERMVLLSSGIWMIVNIIVIDRGRRVALVGREAVGRGTLRR